MWRLGFYVWRVWLYAKYGLPALGFLVLLYAVSGPSRLFWGALCVVVLIGCGLLLALGEFASREFGEDDIGTGRGWRR